MARPTPVTSPDQPDRTHPHRPVDDRADRPNSTNTAGGVDEHLSGRVDFGVRHNRHLAASSFQDRTLVRSNCCAILYHQPPTKSSTARRVFEQVFDLGRRSG
jgi:hypothetical protein